ncbi:MAG: DUF423 domain-containing protein [Deltaproteobacteria bacterium]|nr:DUF423 domain-containing protein [Deltaproteobacteria bacterium]
MDRAMLIASGVAGFLAVAFGAFGAHGLKSRLEPLSDGALRLSWWQTGAQYHLAHALAIAVAAWLVSRGGGTAAAVSGWAFVAGIVLFSGSLYVMTLTGVRGLGAVTPIGGVAFLVGWAAVVVAAIRMAGSSS